MASGVVDNITPTKAPWNAHVEAFTAEMQGILADRGTQYNGTEDDSRYQNFKNTADIMSIVLQNNLKPDCPITPRQVALMMVGMKLAREVAGPKHDNVIDVANYALIADSL